MAQETRVHELSAKAAAELEVALRSAFPDAEWRTVQHTRFAMRMPGLVCTCYQSGKLVLQGHGMESFEQRFLDGSQARTPASAGRQASVMKAIDDVASIGSDEAGKGDYFGPLTVAAVFATGDDLDKLRAAGVADSKVLSDARVRTLAEHVRGLVDHEVSVLMPADYNQTYASVRNLNEMLAAQHARLLAVLLQRHDEKTRLIVDRFVADSVIERHLRRLSVRAAELINVPRAEAHPAVAAASILARDAFLNGLNECANLCGTDLHKGAGSPVDIVGRRVFAIGGMALLAKVAKLHFRNTARATS